MKKFYYLIFAFVLTMSFSITTNAQPLQTFEGATFPPDGWTLQYTGTQYWTRSSPPGAYNLSSASAKFNFFSASSGTIQSLITPKLKASVAGDSVKFDLSYHTYTTEVDSLIIETSSDNGATYTTLVALAGGPNVGTGMVTWAANTSSAPPTQASQWGTFAYALPPGVDRIKFRARSAFGNNLYIDNISTRIAVPAFANDVGTTVILSPTSASEAGSIAPKATIKNFGSNGQGPFNVTCLITPGGVPDVVSAPSLASLASTDITFSNFVFNAGVTYTVTVYTQLGSDENRTNDTQRVSVTLINQNYGNDTNYYFANSLATNQPSYPEFCWKDTTGSKNLILDTAIVGTGLVFVGNNDDGYFKISLKQILAELGQDTITQRSIKYNGICYDSIFPTTNGIIGLTDNAGLTGFSPSLTSTVKPSVYPYWRDLDWGFMISGSNRMSIKIKGNQLIVTYDRVQHYNAGAIGPDYISFQTCFELVNNCANPNSNIRFSYADTLQGQTSGSLMQKYIGSTTLNNGAQGTHLIGLGTPTTQPYRFMNPTVTATGKNRPMFTPGTYNSLAVEFGPNQNSLNNHDCLLLHVALTMQGLQSNGSGSTPRVRDTVEIILRDAAIAPYKILQKYKVLLDSAYNNSGNYSYGYKDIDFTLLKRNYPYYLEVKHRSSVFVWSNPVSTSGDILSYDFTTGIGKTYGNNAVVINGTASMYSGDITSSVEAITQDGCVTLTDLLNVYNESLIFAAGPYVLADLNYDGIVDLSDLVLVYNNNVAFICGIQPPGAVSAADFPATNFTGTRVINNVSVKPVTIIPDPNYVDKEALQKEALMNEEKK